MNVTSLKKMKIFFYFSIVILSFPVFAESVNPDAARTNAKLGMAYLQKGYYAPGKKCLLISLNEDPQIASPWYSMAYFLEKTRHEKLAAQYYQKALSINPRSGAAKNNYGIFLCHQHYYKQAVSEFVLAANEPLYLHAAKAYKNAGQCALRMHDKKLARYYFREASANDPRNEKI
ncbi:MAG: hypothetical protein NTZ67_01120 [Gammaproteobacteria bacterium]|nr:hypothetical protein [Gammaproteobacteria bacterium]